MRQWKVGERLFAKLLGCERVPIVVVHQDRQDYGNSLVVMRQKDAAAWFGIGESQEPPGPSERHGEALSAS